MNEIVRQSPVTADGVDLLVSTVKIGPNYYDTVVFDESPNKRHAGKRLAGHENEGRTYGPWIIDKLNIRSETRKAAMDQHREALYAARTERPV